MAYCSSSGVRVAWERERRCRRSVIAGTGSVIADGGSAERRVKFASLSCFFEKLGMGSSFVPWVEVEGKTMPGESRSLSLLSSFTSRRAVVTPASAPTGHAVDEEREEPRREVSALMTDDLPTFG